MISAPLQPPAPSVLPLRGLYILLHLVTLCVHCVPMCLYPTSTPLVTHWYPTCAPTCAPCSVCTLCAPSPPWAPLHHALCPLGLLLSWGNSWCADSLVPSCGVLLDLRTPPCPLHCAPLEPLWEPLYLASHPLHPTRTPWCPATLHPICSLVSRIACASVATLPHISARTGKSITHCNPKSMHP